jgi:transposase
MSSVLPQTVDLHTVHDAAVLRQMVLRQIAEHDELILEHQQALTGRDTLIAGRDRDIVYKDAKIATLMHELARIKRWIFAARSEKLDPAQRAMFDEAMGEDSAALDVQLEALREPAPARDVPKREALPAHLPRIETRIELESCQCAACGAALSPVGEDVTELLDCEPIRFFVRKQVRPKYACRMCQTITAAPVPPAIIDRGRPAPGLLAQVLIAKYADHTPLYRQESIYRRSGVELPRSTLAGWVGACGVALQPLVAAMQAELLAQPVLHADETPVAQLNPGAGKTHRAYLFAYRSADPQTDVTIFDYCQTRSGKHATQFLGDWRGALMVDDFGGYKALFPQITELACWAHVRRTFFDLVQSKSSTRAHEVLEPIARLYQIEAHAKGLDPPQRQRYRQQHAAPILERIRQWLADLRPCVADGTGLAKAIDYTRKRWVALTRYLDDGRYPLDNNPVENAIRPIALGRKNWLFTGSERAGQRAAAIMSLIATAKNNGHDPHAWLRDVLTRLPTHPDRRIAELLPHRWQPEAV